MVIQLKIAPWDKIFEFEEKKGGKKIKESEYKIGDCVVVKIESHTDLAKIIDLVDEKKNDEVMIVRKATERDFEKMKEKEKRKQEFLERAEKIVKKSSLPIKLVDVHFSLDGGKIIFAFTAPGKVDFRDLVKNLSQEFHCSIRLHQINPREEMKIFSGIGACGRYLCCLSFLKNLGGIKTNLIDEQKLGHRGLDRLSGLCGRLKCCLAFEKEFYQEESEKQLNLDKGNKIKKKNS